MLKKSFIIFAIWIAIILVVFCIGCGSGSGGVSVSGSSNYSESNYNDNDTTSQNDPSVALTPYPNATSSNPVATPTYDPSNPYIQPPSSSDIGIPPQAQYTDLTDPTPKVRYGVFVGAQTGGLSAPEQDQRDLANALAPGSGNGLWMGSQRILLLTSTKNATKASILSTLSELSKKATENDLILFSYSGHGSGGNLNLGGSYLSANELAAALNRFYSYTKKVVILDCCDSGKALDSLLRVPNISIMTATAYNTVEDAQEGYVSGTSEYKMQGYFSGWLLQCLGANGDTAPMYSSFTDIFSYVYSQVYNSTYTNTTPSGQPYIQHPAYGGDLTVILKGN